MASGMLTPEVWKHLVSTSDDYELFEPFTEWVPAMGLDDVKVVWKQKAQEIKTSGDFEVRPAIQTASVRTTEPDDWSTLGTAVAGNDETCDEFDIATTTVDKFFVRFGVAYKLSTNAVQGEADVSLQVSYNSCGRIVGGKTETFSTNTVSDQMRPVTGWIPAVGVAKVKAAIIVQCGSATFRGRLTYRTADTSSENPNGWTDIDSPHSDGEHNTNEINIASALIDKMWVQFGIRYDLSSSGTWTTGTISTAVSVRAT